MMVMTMILMMLLTFDVTDNHIGVSCCICRKQWALYFYYDMKTKKVHIGVSEDQKENARKEVEQETIENYEIEDDEEGQFVCTLAVPNGQKIRSAKSKIDVLFSGTIIDEKTGVTVAHGFEHGHEKVLWSVSTDEVANEIIGKCRKTSVNVSDKTTADLALIDLEPNFYISQNTVPWPNRINATSDIHIKLNCTKTSMCQTTNQ